MQISRKDIYSLTTPPHAHVELCTSSPYIVLAFINTMSQNHSTTDGIPGRDQIDNTVGSTQAPNNFSLLYFLGQEIK